MIDKIWENVIDKIWDMSLITVGISLTWVGTMSLIRVWTVSFGKIGTMSLIRVWTISFGKIGTMSLTYLGGKVINKTRGGH